MARLKRQKKRTTIIGLIAIGIITYWLSGFSFMTSKSSWDLENIKRPPKLNPWVRKNDRPQELYPEQQVTTIKESSKRTDDIKNSSWHML